MLFVQQLLQVVCRVVAFAVERAPETAGLHAYGGVGAGRAFVGVRFAANQVALDIEIANLRGGPAQLLEQAEGVLPLLLVRREIRKHGEQLKLGFDAAGRGAQIVDCPLSGLAMHSRIAASSEAATSPRFRIGSANWPVRAMGVGCLRRRTGGGR